MHKKSILFVCVGNACRSQMAEGFAKKLGGSKIEIFSAGSHPSGWVAPGVIITMKEKGIDFSGHFSKSLEELPRKDFDVVVTMCEDNCPMVHGKERFHWPIPDPVGEPLEEFRKVRDTIEEKVRALLDALSAQY